MSPIRQSRTCPSSLAFEASISDQRQPSLQRQTRGSSPSFPSSVSLPSLQRPRRVNPDVLVNRLPAGLVADMDKLVREDPHTMPSYAVRKELQERYDIDRRPIYEYFHAHGCRMIRKNIELPERSISVRQLLLPHDVHGSSPTSITPDLVSSAPTRAARKKARVELPPPAVKRVEPTIKPTVSKPRKRGPGIKRAKPTNKGVNLNASSIYDLDDVSFLLPTSLDVPPRLPPGCLLVNPHTLPAGAWEAFRPFGPSPDLSSAYQHMAQSYLSTPEEAPAYLSLPTSVSDAKPSSPLSMLPYTPKPHAASSRVGLGLLEPLALHDAAADNDDFFSAWDTVEAALAPSDLLGVMIRSSPLSFASQHSFQYPSRKPISPLTIQEHSFETNMNAPVPSTNPTMLSSNTSPLYQLQSEVDSHKMHSPSKSQQRRTLYETSGDHNSTTLIRDMKGTHSGVDQNASATSLKVEDEEDGLLLHLAFPRLPRPQETDVTVPEPSRVTPEAMDGFDQPTASASGSESNHRHVDRHIARQKRSKLADGKFDSQLSGIEGSAIVILGAKPWHLPKWAENLPSESELEYQLDHDHSAGSIFNQSTSLKHTKSARVYK